MANSLLSALLGAARGGNTHIQRRNERRQELEDQAKRLQQQRALARFQAKLAEAAAEQSSELTEGRNIASEGRRIEDAIGQAIGGARGQGISVPDVASKVGQAGRGASNELIAELMSAAKLKGDAVAERDAAEAARQSTLDEQSFRASEGKARDASAERRATTVASGGVGRGVTFFRDPETGEVIPLPRGGDPGVLPPGAKKVGTETRDPGLTEAEKASAEERAVVRLLGDESTLVIRQFERSGFRSLAEYVVAEKLVDRKRLEALVVEEEAKEGGGVSAADQEILELQKSIAAGLAQLNATEE